MRKLDRRGRVILSFATAAAVIVNVGAAWVYSSVSEAATVAVAGAGAELRLHGQSDERQPLYPGGTADLTVTVTNRNDFPVRVTTVGPGVGAVVADDAHRAAGCWVTGVAVSAALLPVSWRVPRNTIGVFTLAGGLRMTDASDRACAGATFTVPVSAVLNDASEQ